MATSIPPQCEWIVPDAAPPDFDAQASGYRHLDAVELRRRLWHIAPGFLPIGLWIVPHRDPLSPILLVFLCAVVAGFGINAFFRYGHIARNGDRDKSSSVFGYTLSIIGTLVLFPGAPELGLSVLAILAFGDGSATLGGMSFGGPRLPWNRGKTWSGLACFLLAGIPMGSVVYWGETALNPEALPPDVTFGMAVFIAGTAVTGAALMESLRMRLNDNIRVGATAAIVLAAMHHWLVG